MNTPQLSIVLISNLLMEFHSCDIRLMAEYDVIVVGGGISGMSFAYYAAGYGLRTLVLERDDAPGGCIRSERLAGGFWFELGAHTCYNSYRTLIEVLEERGVRDQLLKRAKVPFRLFTRDGIRPIAKELHFIELLFSLRHLITARKEGMSVRSYYAQLVGERNYERVFGPLFAAVPSQRADDFPADMLFKRRERRKDILRSFTMAGGLQTMIDALASDRRITVQTNAEVTLLERNDEGTITFVMGRGRSHNARYAAIAAPPPIAAALVGRGHPEIAAALAQIKTNAVHSYGVVVRKERTAVEPVAGIIPLDYRFFSAVSRDTVPDPEWRGFTFHFKAGVSKDTALRHVTEVLKLEERMIEHVFEREVMLPSPVVGHQRIIAAIDQHLRGTPIFITGNYFGGLAIEDCVIRSRQEAARLPAARQ